MVCAVRGHAARLVMPDKVSLERKRIIRAFGAEVVLTDPLEGTDGAIREARRLAANGDHVYVDQYSNPANPLAHELTTGPEIWSQTEERVTHFVAGVGTSGTIVGVSAALRPRGVRIVAVQPDDALHGIEGWKHMPTALRPRDLGRARRGRASCDGDGRGDSDDEAARARGGHLQRGIRRRGRRRGRRRREGTTGPYRRVDR